MKRRAVWVNDLEHFEPFVFKVVGLAAIRVCHFLRSLVITSLSCTGFRDIKTFTVYMTTVMTFRSPTV